MKKTLVLLGALALVFCFMAGVWAEGGQEEPELVLTYVPPYGDMSDFEGYVRGSADPTQYRITLYLQVTPYGQYYVKPTAESPSVAIQENGVFHLDYTTGEHDPEAISLYVLLIPGDYSPPVNGLWEALDAALDHVEVTRTEEGGLTVSPDRRNHGKTLPCSTGYGRLLMNVGFYIDGSSPGQGLNTSLIARQLDAAAAFSSVIRLYGASGELYPAYKMAHDRGLNVLGSAYLSGNEADDMRELDSLIAHCNSGYASVAIVGNETRLFDTVPEDRLLEYMAYVRARLADPAIPVVTSDSLYILLNSPRLRDASDFLLVNEYPFHNGLSIANAADSLASAVNTLKRRAQGKQVVLGETGWPTAGSGTGGAETGGRNAAEYFETVWGWSLASGTPVIWFEAADEPWKGGSEGSYARHWGFMNTDLTLKDCYADTGFFQSMQAGITPKLVRFVPGEGSGGLLYRGTGADHRFILPTCPFAAPQGMEFGGWLVEETVYQPGDVCPFTANATVTARWVPGRTYVIESLSVSSGEVCFSVINNSGSGAHLLIAAYGPDGQMLDYLREYLSTEVNPQGSSTSLSRSLATSGAALVRAFLLDGNGRPLSRSRTALVP